MAFPIAPLLWIAIWIYMRNRKGGGGGGEINFSPGFWLFIWLLAVWNTVFCAGFLFAGMAVSENPAYIVPALAAAIFCFPWTFARWFLIPAGWPRATYYVLRIPGVTFWKDRKGGALAGAAWAHLRSSRRNPSAESWLARQIASLCPLRAGGVAALALFRAAKGERVFVRRLMELVLTFDRKARPPRILRIAAEWLAADAAERGDWKTVRSLGSRPGRRSRLTYFASLASRRLLGDEPPHPLLLRLAWLLAPNRSGTLGLLRLALEEPGRTVEEEELAECPASFPELLKLQAALWRDDPVSLREVDRVQAGWSRLFAAGVPASLRERAGAMAAANADHVWADARSRILDDLVSVMRTHALPASALTPTAISEELRSRMEDEGMEELEELEEAASALARRKAAQQSLPIQDELVEWCALRALYESVAGSAASRMQPLAFASVYPAASNHAVWLFNGRGERPLGNAMLRFLLEEAHKSGDAEAIRLQTANVAIPV